MPAAEPTPAPQPLVLKADAFRHYVEDLNRDDKELYQGHFPNSTAWDFLQANIPLFDCPDEDIQTTYYFRWWVYRKHIKQTPAGFVVDEFLPNVGWAGKYNTIDCAAGHHFYEGRWLRNAKYLDDYARFWFRGGGEPRRYSFWAADAIWARTCATGDQALPIELLPDLIANYQAWETSHRDANGLYWQIDDRDGMESSLGGSGYRATINSYQFGDALAIANIADLAGQSDLAREYREKAATIKRLVQDQLWDAGAVFQGAAARPERTACSGSRAAWLYALVRQLARSAICGRVETSPGPGGISCAVRTDDGRAALPAFCRCLRGARVPVERAGLAVCDERRSDRSGESAEWPAAGRDPRRIISPC